MVQGLKPKALGKHLPLSCMCVCVSGWVVYVSGIYTYMDTHVHVYTWIRFTATSTSAEARGRDLVLSCRWQPLLLETKSLAELGVRLTSSQAQHSSCPCPYLLHWNYEYTCLAVSSFHVGTGIQTKVLMLVQQTLLSSGPAPQPWRHVTAWFCLFEAGSRYVPLGGLELAL